MRTPDYRVIGAGLAGSEAALTLARKGYYVELWEQKPSKFSAVHRLSGAAELVCSNSLKSTELSAAHGLLKAELSSLGSPLIELAYKSRIPGGKALTVDRDIFSKKVTEAIEAESLISWKRESYDRLPDDKIKTLFATGPLTSDVLMSEISKLLGEENLYFYDATSPVLELDSLDMDHFFWASRNDDLTQDYLNLPLNKEQYIEFHKDLVEADKAPAHLEEEKLQFFEGCLPIEVLAERGQDTLAFGPMKPVGLRHPKFPKTYAVIQFRREKAAGELLNMVGFQTRMKWPEQERVFKKLPGMKDASFVRLGAMHRNSFINTPHHLDERMSLKAKPTYFFAGQITGSEGYTEAICSGHYAALQMTNQPALPEQTAMKSLIRYLVSSDPKYFQPMNFNFGLLPDLDEAEKIQYRKKFRKEFRHELKREKSRRALAALEAWKEQQNNKLSA